MTSQVSERRQQFLGVWRTPMSQILLISCIGFCCNGMYNAILGLGGSGQVDTTVAANATVAKLAATAGLAMLVVPPVFDLLGPCACLLIGAWCYPLYAGSLLCYNHTKNAAFVIAGGAMLGFGASFVWVSEGAIMVSYPHPDEKGRAIALFWIIFNFGAGIGSFISFALNFHSTSGTVSDGTYVSFMCIMALGWILCSFVSPPHKVIRRDGSTAGTIPSYKKGKPLTSVKRELYNLLDALRNWKVILLMPALFSSNFFYSYQQNAVNGATFTLRTRSLNDAMYWIAQMFGGLIIGFLLDLKYLSRPQRAKLGYIFILVCGLAIWGGGLAFQRWEDKQGKKHWLDLSDSRTYVGPFWLYFFYGAFDAFWQSYCYWIAGALADSPQAAAKLVGLYKTLQAGGGAVAWRINALGFSAIKQFTINWALLGAALLVLTPTMLSITKSPGTEELADGNGQAGDDVSLEKRSDVSTA